MFTSKIIKTEDKEHSVIKTFLLKQFPGGEKDVQKSPNVRPRDASRSTTRDARRLEAERLKISARQEAQQLTERAHKEARRIEKDAFAKGFSQGERAGRAKAENELADLIATVKNTIKAFEKTSENFYAEHHDLILDLALKVARKVIHQEVQTNKEIVLGILSSAIKHAIDRERLHVRVHPDDFEVCSQRRMDFIKHIDGIRQIEFEPDESVTRGGAIVEYAYGEIDARLDRQFEEVERELQRSDSNAENGA